MRPRQSALCSILTPILVAAACLLMMPGASLASEADLVLPDLNNPAQQFFGMTGHTLLTLGLVIAALVTSPTRLAGGPYFSSFTS